MPFKIKYNTDNKIINGVLNDNFITVVTNNQREALEYMSHQIITVFFVYNGKLASQAFYKNTEQTWVPFNGIKANLNKEKKFIYYFDTSNFGIMDNFGLEELMVVSYLLGGGMWVKDNEHLKRLKLHPRMRQFELESHKIKFHNSLLVNHFVNYSICSNYLKPQQKFKSAFDKSHKAENSTQVEYTPKNDSLCKELDKALSNDNVITPIEESNTMCAIL